MSRRVAPPLRNDVGSPHAPWHSGARPPSAAGAGSRMAYGPPGPWSRSGLKCAVPQCSQYDGAQQRRSGKQGDATPRGKVWSRGSSCGVGTSTSWAKPLPWLFHNRWQAGGLPPCPTTAAADSGALGSPTLAVWRKRTQGRALVGNIRGSSFLAVLIFSGRPDNVRPQGPSPQPGPLREINEAPRLHAWARTWQGED